MKENQKSYKEIFFTSTLFGGVQIFNIIFSIIRSKAAAFFIGPLGIGVLGLLNSTVNIVSQVTKLGVDVTAVKEIAYANSKNDSKEINRILNLVRRLVLLTGFFGAILTFAFSSVLSSLTFGDGSYTWAFMCLSIVVLLKQLTAGNLSVLRGFRKHKLLVKANVYAGFLSVIVTVFCYYFFGIKSIVYVILITTFIVFMFSLIFSRAIFNYKSFSNISFKDFINQGSPMIRLGFYLSLVSVFALMSTYIFQIYLRKNSDLSEVGFYQAAFVILNTYVGLVFNALRTDYFPRLSQVHDDVIKLQNTVLQQARVTTLLITPVAVVFIVLSAIIIEVLYSGEFLVISSLLTWAMLGVVFKSASFTLGYVILAKNDSKLFLKTSLCFNTIFLLLSILGYKYYGLDGIGMAYLVYFLIHFISLKIIVKYKYNIKLSKSYLQILTLAFILCLCAFLITFINSFYLKLVLNVFISVITGLIVYKEINKLIDIKKYLDNFRKRRNEVD